MLIFDGHCDSLSKFQEDLREDFSPRQFDFAKVQNLDWIQVMAAFSWKENRAEITFDDFLYLYEKLKSQLPQNNAMLKEKKDFFHRHEKMPHVVFAVEGAEFLQGDLNRIYNMYQLGVRMFGLTWNHDNFMAGGCKNNDLGLTQAGRAGVKLLNELDIIIDCAHLSHRGLKEVLALTEKPIAVSHTACDKLCKHKRNLNDDEIKEIAAKDGVIGICFVDDFLYNKGMRKANISDVVEHIYHIADLVGSEYVALGSDFDGVDRPLNGLEYANHLLRLPAYLRAMGFGQGDIENVMGRNWLRIFGT